jgi:hypothetical protein
VLVDLVPQVKAAMDNMMLPVLLLAAAILTLIPALAIMLGALSSLDPRHRGLRRLAETIDDDHDAGNSKPISDKE